MGLGFGSSTDGTSSGGKFGDTVSACSRARPIYIWLLICVRAFWQFKAYLCIEVFIWLPTMWLACYRFQPAIRFVQHPTGRDVVMRGSAFLERYAASTHQSLKKLADRIYGSPNGRTTAEWLLINKVLSPVAFPLKMWVGHLWVERRRKANEALLPEKSVAA
jgi:hypothetical protein